MENQELIHGDVTPKDGECRFTELERVEKFKIKLWVEYLKEALNYKSIYALQKHFSGDDKFIHKTEGTTHPTDWNKYFNGTRIPSLKTLDKAYKEVPSSEYIYNMPFWRLVTERVSKEYINDALSATSPDIKKILFNPTGISGLDWKRKDLRKNDRIRLFLRRKGTIDALNVIMLLMAEDEFNFSIISFVDNRSCLMNTMVNVCSFPPFDEPNTARFLYECIIKRFFIPLNLPEELSFYDKYQYPSPYHMVRWVNENKDLLEYLEAIEVIDDTISRERKLDILNKYYELPRHKKSELHAAFRFYFCLRDVYEKNIETYSVAHLPLFQ
ncbi:hypothetical protein [Kangiella sp. TOML190]|uniref:hypothetical protein n=1 Tax=Kangiella sp. TOML190 TaxID=2931351 RepID=UPI00203ADFB1|nr:hypothetical protein [Kangiella sp. TOML190]